MTSKELLFFFFFCVCVSMINASKFEEECRDWYDTIKQAHYEACKHTISEESLQELDDDLEADNEEIRAWRNCLLIKCGFIVNAKIDVQKILNYSKRYYSNVNFLQWQSVEKYLDICKTEAEQSDVDIDVAGRFANCALDRSKTGI